jgi:hypothetical protein
MQPRDTIYRLAGHPRDYQWCHQLFNDQGLDDQALSWPTIMALKDDELVGCLSTTPSKTAVIAGPMTVKKAHPLITIIRLIEAYDVIMRAAGVTSYDFGIDGEAHPSWLKIVHKHEMHPYAYVGEVAWFTRKIGG